MNTYAKIISYLTLFFIFILLLQLVGLVSSTMLEIVSYYGVALGICMVFISFGNEKRTVLFSGTVIFLLGTLLLILTNFDFYKIDDIIVPSFLFLLGAGFLVLFLDKLSNKKNLVVSIIFWLLGFSFILFVGDFNLQIFGNTIKDVAFNFWTVILLVVGAFLFLKNYTKKN